MEQSSRRAVRPVLKFTLIAFSFIVALVGYILPQTQRPIDFLLVFWGSLPLAGIWLAVLLACSIRLGKSGLLALFGSPMALYWPVWLLPNHIPECYWHHNCI